MTNNDSANQGRLESSPSRMRVAAELLAFLVGSALYLGLWRHRPAYADMTVGVVGMSLIFALAWRTRAQIWGDPLPNSRRRLLECARAMFAATAPVVVAFAITGWISWQAKTGNESLPHRFFRMSFFASLLFYFVYAWFQQALFQFYLLGRLWILLPRAPKWLLALINGLLYAAMHLSVAPDPILIALTLAGGFVWTMAYFRWRALLPLALSHAVLGATYFYWVRGDDKIGRMVMGLFSGQ
ncbi:MAG TPA: CPBP family intramembrane glutamic endopeptidase [Planctomycetota bacterium]|nr:CPBP family intramembrane glutamic endopeptidase [Planctomycetota bacterium]